MFLSTFLHDILSFLDDLIHESSIRLFSKETAVEMWKIMSYLNLGNVSIILSFNFEIFDFEIPNTLLTTHTLWQDF